MKHSAPSSKRQSRSQTTRERRSRHRGSQSTHSQPTTDTLSEFLHFFQIEKLPQHERLHDTSARSISNARLRLLEAIFSCCFLMLVLRSAFIMLMPDKKLENQAMIQLKKRSCLKVVVV